MVNNSNLKKKIGLQGQGAERRQDNNRRLYYERRELLRFSANRYQRRKHDRREGN